MNQNQAMPSQEDKIMAALAHICVILPLWGLVGAIVIWATQKEKSRFVAFQALQATAYQLSLVLLYLVGMVCYMVSFFGFMFTIPFMEETGAGPPPGFFLPFCVLGCLMLLGLAYLAYGFWAAVATLRGQDFRYVILGQWLEDFMSGREKDVEGRLNNSAE